MKKLLIILLLIPVMCFGQPGGDDDVVDIPIDGGITLLFIAAILYTSKKLYCYKSQNVNQ